jgi:hypothetical protein
MEEKRKNLGECRLRRFGGVGKIFFLASILK